MSDEWAMADLTDEERDDLLDALEVLHAPTPDHPAEDAREAGGVVVAKVRAEASLLPDSVIPHEGDCAGSLCGACGHCLHSIDDCDCATCGCLDHEESDEEEFRKRVIAVIDMLTSERADLIAAAEQRGAEEREREVVTDLCERLEAACQSLSDMRHRPAITLSDVQRLTAKREGVVLALSYADDRRRALGGTAGEGEA